MNTQEGKDRIVQGARLLFECMQEGAQGIFRSLHELLELPPETELWPGHLGGSLCGGAGMDLKIPTA
jgi:hypothetical protein